MIELLEAERRVAKTNAHIERQRQLIEELGYQGYDITSAQIVFDSLCVSLSLHLQERHRLRAMLKVRQPDQNIGSDFGEIAPETTWPTKRCKLSVSTEV